jgi:general stress protein YciG
MKHEDENEQVGHVSLPRDGGIVAKARRGFAVMDRDKQREIASKGGRAAHEKGTAHRWSEEEAKEAGRKGGAASHRNGHRTGPRTRTTDDSVTAEPQGGESSTDEPTDETSTMRNGG